MESKLVIDDIAQFEAAQNGKVLWASLSKGGELSFAIFSNDWQMEHLEAKKFQNQRVRITVEIIDPHWPPRL